MKTTYLYRMEDYNIMTIYRREDNKIFRELEVRLNYLPREKSIEMMDRLIDALNGTTAEPRTVWHPKAVEALREAERYLDNHWFWAGDPPKTKVRQPAVQLALDAIREALALINQSPPDAPKSFGYIAMNQGKVLTERPFSSAEIARAEHPNALRIVRLVEEPSE